MRKMTKLVVIVILSALTTTIAFAAQREQSATSRQNSGIMAMPMVAPLFLDNQEFSSTLYMVNELNIPATAKVTLFDLNGTKIAEKNVEFKPNSQQELSLRQMLEAARATATLGSLRMQPLTDFGVGVLAQLGITHSGNRETYFDEELLMPSAEGSQILRSVADDGSSSVVAITSLSEMRTQHISVSCVLEHSQYSNRIVLAPNETVVSHPCTDEKARTFYGATNTDFPDDASDTHRRSRAAGVSITSDGMPGEFSAYGVVYHRTDDTGYFSAMNFSDPKMLNTSGFVYTGVPVGDQTNLLPQGKYVPQVYLANFGENAAAIEIVFASTTAGHPTAQPLQTVMLRPRSAKTVAFPDLKGNDELQNSFVVRSNAAPGVVLSKLVAIGNGQLRELELIGKDEKQMENAGGHPWSVEDGTTSTMLLFNHTSKPQYFNVRVADDKTLWLKVYKLAGMETKAISLNVLIEQQVKDDKGHVLPKDIARGEASWLVPATTEVSGRILQSNSVKAMARNFSCGTCAFICQNPYLDPFITIDMFIGAQAPLGGITPDWCNIPCQAYTTCPAHNNPTTHASGGLLYSWSGGAPAASLVSGQSSATSNWKGVAAGFGSASYILSMQGGPKCNGGGSINVKPAPDHLVVQSDTTSVFCTTSIRRIITYSEVDASGNNVGTINTKEQFGSKSTNTCNTTINTSDTCSPDSGGILSDDLKVGCNSVGGSCGFTYTKQQWLYCPAGGGTPVVIATPGDLVVHNNSITVSGHSSFSTGTKIFADGTITP